LTLKSRASAGTPESWRMWVKGVVVMVDPRASRQAVVQAPVCGDRGCVPGIR
jgi:hypothetical protein